MIGWMLVFLVGFPWVSVMSLIMLQDERAYELDDGRLGTE
jgi:hypothetical protein